MKFSLRIIIRTHVILFTQNYYLRRRLLPSLSLSFAQIPISHLYSLPPTPPTNQPTLWLLIHTLICAGAIENSISLYIPGRSRVLCIVVVVSLYNIIKLYARAAASADLTAIKHCHQQPAKIPPLCVLISPFFFLYFNIIKVFYFL